MTFEEWLLYGVGEGWVSPVICETHDGVPMQPEEEQAWEDGWDPCIRVMRVWPDNIPE